MGHNEMMTGTKDCFSDLHRDRPFRYASFDNGTHWTARHCERNEMEWSNLLLSWNCHGFVPQPTMTDFHFEFPHCVSEWQLILFYTVLELGGFAAQLQHRSPELKLSFRMKWNGMRNLIILSYPHYAQKIGWGLAMTIWQYCKYN